MAKLSYEERKQIPASEFAIPETRSYPLSDINHAKNALARVSQFGSDSEKSRVRAAVHRRYPEIGRAHSMAQGLK